MSMRRPFPATELSNRSPRRLSVGAVVSALGACALLLGACSSSSSSSSSSSTSSVATLQSLQSWPTSAVSLQETGSSLLYPLFNLWVAQTEKEWPNVTITTAATGSGTGVSQAAAGTVAIGASDAYLSPAQVAKTPGLLNVPLAISGQQVNYNLPGVTGHVKLDASVLAQIYQGTITNWDDPAIAALNNGLTLPNLKIVPIHRSDSSGDTFLFTSFLSDADSAWSKSIGFGTTVAFPPVPGAVAAQGNGGMVTACAANPGCVAYIGVSYLQEAIGKGLGYAALENKSGNFELPTEDAIAAGAAAFATSTPANGAVSMIYGSNPNGYPIVNYEYAIVQSSQPNTLTAQAVKAFLAWAIDPNNGNAPSFLDQVNFVALPSTVTQISVDLLAKIS